MRKWAILIIMIVAVAGMAPCVYANPVVGICTILSPNILGDKDNEAPNMITEATSKKDNPMSYVIDRTTSATDFKNYLGTKDILISEVPKMIQDLKLPVFLEYGTERNLDFLMVVFCDAKPEKYEKKTASGWLGSSSGGYNSGNKILVKKVELVSRVVVVDVCTGSRPKLGASER